MSRENEGRKERERKRRRASQQTTREGEKTREERRRERHTRAQTRGGKGRTTGYRRRASERARPAHNANGSLAHPATHIATPPRCSSSSLPASLALALSSCWLPQSAKTTGGIGSWQDCGCTATLPIAVLLGRRELCLCILLLLLPWCCVPHTHTHTFLLSLHTTVPPPTFSVQPGGRVLPSRWLVSRGGYHKRSSPSGV